MHNEEIVIDKSKLWSYNEANYTEEFRKKLREERVKDANATIDRLVREKNESYKKQQVVGTAINKCIQDNIVNGRIINPFIKQSLDAKITAARWALALAMGATILFKGFWALWLIFILIYKMKVKQLQKDAAECDVKWRNNK